MPRIGQAYGNTNSETNVDVANSLLRFRHTRTAREREEAAKLHTGSQIVATSTCLFPIVAQARPTIVDRRLFVSLILCRSPLVSRRTVMETAGFLTFVHDKTAGI